VRSGRPDLRAPLCDHKFAVMMECMRGRVLVWCGGGIAAAAPVGLVVYLSLTGLDKAEKLVAVFGLLITMAGLSALIYGVVISQRAVASGSRPAQDSVSALGSRSVAIGGENSGVISTGDGATNVQMRAEATGQARVYQAGRDQTINER
jgi:hypothetical protein